MALNFKIETKIDVTGKIIYLVDRTGEYDAVTNEGGWGAPNSERSLVALMAIVEMITTEGDNTVLSPITNHIIYNPVATNAYESTYQFTFSRDGGCIHYFLKLPVSIDGLVDLEANAITTGTYFYMTSGIIYQKEVGGTNREITDYLELVNPDNINKPFQANCQKLWTPLLMIKDAELFQDYREARRNEQDETEILFEGLELGNNIKHANGAFYQGLQLEAADIIETNLQRYGL